MCTNAALGDALGLSHSTISRMRAGSRTGSIATLRRLADLSKMPLERVLNASEKAKTGDLEEWRAILDLACGDPKEPDVVQG